MESGCVAEAAALYVVVRTLPTGTGAGVQPHAVAGVRMAVRPRALGAWVRDQHSEDEGGATTGPYIGE